MVPISRQPKEKIQAIIESCTRQFPEFSERARKRIRTYLKSCRRTKRHKTAPVVAPGSENGTVSGTGRAWNESSVQPQTTKSGPTSHVSYHLTSPMAEQILATACDNECQNAKRMRMGLKPISVRLSISFLWPRHCLPFPSLSYHSSNFMSLISNDLLRLCAFSHMNPNYSIKPMITANDILLFDSKTQTQTPSAFPYVT